MYMYKTHSRECTETNPPQIYHRLNYRTLLLCKGNLQVDSLAAAECESRRTEINPPLLPPSPHAPVCIEYRAGCIIKFYAQHSRLVNRVKNNESRRGSSASLTRFTSSGRRERAADLFNKKENETSLQFIKPAVSFPFDFTPLNPSFTTYSGEENLHRAAAM